MLGKGLESLIPPQKGNGQPNGAPDPQANLSEPVSPALEEQPHEATQRASAPEPAQAATPAAEPSHDATSRGESHEPPGAPPSTIPFSPKVFEDRADKRAANDDERIFHIEADKIVPNPDQPRRNFNQEALRDLANSIREFGLLQPLVVSRIEKETPHGVEVEYQLIAGERRLMASKMLGLRSVPAIVRNVNLEREKLELAVIENIQRENLNPIETARAFQRLQEEFRMTQREIASKLGKSREVIANTMRLLDLPPYLQEAVQKGEISESHARFLLGITDPGTQKQLFDEIVKDKLTVRDLKMRMDETGGAGGSRRGRPPKSEVRLPPELKAMQESLAEELGAPIEISKGAAKGAITITFYSEEELENILRRLGKES